ncbi:hypothetical protein SAMN05216474_0295 [Lishizhenia tianjinensis]|uniref:Uncharacterized protein n=2 Tax=Lishizhenia tianjinensis TaxID=477690 RepID=A0A1I6XLB6_9FLAO|nr:hypothetical protein SAMN05216474_0295 [Lishizhenia tianjinensis]
MYGVQKKAVRHEVRSMIKAGAAEDELVNFTFALKDTAHIMEWKHAREFKYQEMMYDIVHRVYEGDSVLYKCWKDTKETVLSQRYTAWFQAALNQNSPLQKSKTHVLCTADKWNNSFPVYVITEHFPVDREWTNSYFINYTSRFGEVHSPPPQFLAFI